jgi:hypothetical protein
MIVPQFRPSLNYLSQVIFWLDYLVVFLVGMLFPLLLVVVTSGVPYCQDPELSSMKAYLCC